jgi:hypothetical protein
VELFFLFFQRSKESRTKGRVHQECRITTKRGKGKKTKTPVESSSTIPLSCQKNLIELR